MLPLILKYPKTSAALAVVVVVGTAYAVKRAKGAALGLASDLGSAVNPLNPGNVFNATFNEVTRKVTGDDGFSFGGWIYEITHPGWDDGFYSTPYPANPARDATRSASSGPVPDLSEVMP